MNRRSFLTGSLATGGLFLGPRLGWAQDATPTNAEFPSLQLTLTDTGFTIVPTIAANRYDVAVVNTGASAAAHTVVARVPDAYDKEKFTAIMESEDNEGFDFNDLRGAGFPDWPPANGGSVTGVVDLYPGLYVVFDPFSDSVSGRQPIFFDVTGEKPDAPDPGADLDFTIGEMVINMPKGPILTGPARWHISNHGALIHELAVLEVPPGFTFDDFMALMMMPEDATPTPDMKVVEYQPVAAIGLLGSQTESWLDVDLAAEKHYMAVCMFPDATGMPHAMSGMYAFFDIA